MPAVTDLLMSASLQIEQSARATSSINSPVVGGGPNAAQLIGRSCPPRFRVHRRGAAARFWRDAYQAIFDITGAKDERGSVPWQVLSLLDV